VGEEGGDTSQRTDDHLLTAYVRERSAAPFERRLVINVRLARCATEIVPSLYYTLPSVFL
jgi:hypothetical protein